MHFVFLMILICSFVASTFASLWTLNKQGDKWLGMGAAFFLNILILTVATAILYKVDTQTFHKESIGWVDSLGIVLLIFFIPIITVINFYILELVRSRTTNSS